MTCAACQLVNRFAPKEERHLMMAEGYEIILCPLHAQTEAMREALEKIHNDAEELTVADLCKITHDVLATLPPRRT